MERRTGFYESIGEYMSVKPEDRTIFDWFDMKRAELEQEERSCEKWDDLYIFATKAKKELLEEVFAQVLLEFKTNDKRPEESQGI